MLQNVIDAIDRKDIDSFNKFVKNIQSSIELDIIDTKLLTNKDFDFNTKLEYAKKFKRKAFLFDLYHDVRIQFLYYDYNAICHVAMKTLDKKTKLKYLVEAFLKTDENTIKPFIKLLEKNDLYDDFVKLVDKSSSIEVKLMNYFYLNNNTFIEGEDILNSIMFSSLSIKTKINYLVILAKDTRTSEEEVNVIIDSIKELYETYNNSLVNILDEELVELAIDKKNKTIKSIINDINECRSKGTILVHK